MKNGNGNEKKDLDYRLELYNYISQMNSTFERISYILAFVKDQTCKYIYVNSALSDFFGISVPNILYKDSYYLLPYNTQIAIMNESDKKILSGKIQITDDTFRVKNRQGKDAFLRIVKMPVFDKSGKHIIGITGFGIDVSYTINGGSLLMSIIAKKLSEGEKRYLFARSRGLSKSEIAGEMRTSDGTIDSYKKRILKKLDISEDEFILFLLIYAEYLEKDLL